MIVPSDVATRAAEILAADPDIQNFGATVYGKPVTVFNGLDLKNPPSIDDMPAIVVQCGPAQSGLEVASSQYALMVDWALNDPRMDTVNGVKTYLGIPAAGELGRIIMAKLETLSDNLMPSSWTMSVDPVELFPLITGNATISMDLQTVIGWEPTL